MDNIRRSVQLNGTDYYSEQKTISISIWFYSNTDMSCFQEVLKEQVGTHQPVLSHFITPICAYAAYESFGSAALILLRYLPDAELFLLGLLQCFQRLLQQLLVFLY